MGCNQQYEVPLHSLNVSCKNLRYDSSLFAKVTQGEITSITAIPLCDKAARREQLTAFLNPKMTLLQNHIQG